MGDFNLAEFLPYRLAVAAARISREFSDIYRQEFGLSVPEWRVLAHLSQDGAVSVREIHAKVDMDKSKVSRAATRLESAGLIRKEDHPSDGRLVKLSLTAEGAAMMARLIPMAQAFQAKLVQDLGAEAAALQRGLAKIEERP
jgi:DNA-binding MarR family transcriptional regulator